MSKVLVVVAALVAPFVAEATCTWTTNADGQSGNVACTTVAETAIAATDASSLGFPTNQCPKGMQFFACATTAGASVSAAVTLSVYTYNPAAALWGVYPDQNMTTATGQRCQQFDGKWTVVAGGRIAVLPTAGTMSSGGLTVYWNCN